MTKRFLAIAIALASMFATQQAFAKSSKDSTKHSAASKKHHKKAKKTSAASVTAPEAHLSRSSS